MSALGCRSRRHFHACGLRYIDVEQLEQVGGDNPVEDAEAEHGPVDQAAVDAKRALLRGDAAGSADAA